MLLTQGPHFEWQDPTFSCLQLLSCACPAARRSFSSLLKPQSKLLHFLITSSQEDWLSNKWEVEFQNQVEREMMWLNVAFIDLNFFCLWCFALLLKTHHRKHDGTFSSNDCIILYSHELVTSKTAIPEKWLQVHVWVSPAAATVCQL